MDKPDAVVVSFSAILATLEDINSGEAKEHKGSVRAEAMGLSVLIKKIFFCFSDAISTKAAR